MVTTIACFRPHRHQKATDKRPSNRLQRTSLFHRVASCAHASKKFQRFTVLEWVPTKESATCMTRRLRPRHALASGRLLRLSPFRFHTSVEQLPFYGTRALKFASPLAQSPIHTELSYHDY